MNMHQRRMIPLDSRIARWAPIPLRLIVGYGFMAHGVAKLARGPEAFAAILHAIGAPGPDVMAWSTIIDRSSGRSGGDSGCVRDAGRLTDDCAFGGGDLYRASALRVQLKLLSVTAAGAQFGLPGYELNLLYLACLAALVLGGSGPLAINGLVRRRATAGHS